MDVPVTVTIFWPLLQPYLEHLNGLLADLHSPRLEDLHASEVLQKRERNEKAWQCTIAMFCAQTYEFPSRGLVHPPTVH